MIHASIDPELDLIRLSFRYDRSIIERIKAVPYRRYDAETRTWLIPKPQWRRFKRMFSDVPVQISFDQADEFQILEDLYSIPSIKNIKGFRGKLYPFQERGVGFLITRKRCLLADDLGIGKTAQSIAASLELRNRGLIRRVLVFCPKTLIKQWCSEYYRFTGESAIAIIGNKTQRKLAYDLCRRKNGFFAVTNYAVVLREAEELASLNPDVTILDEVTHIKNFRAKTTQMMKRHFRTPYRWALSGTPLENRLEELFSIMEWVDPTILGYWRSFSDRYLVIRERSVYVRGGKKRRFKEVVGYRNLAELRDQLRGWMLRRRKRDVLPDLPEVTFNTYYVQLSPMERRVYSIINRYVGSIYGKYGRSGVTLRKIVFLRECCDHPALVEDVLRDELGFEPVKIEESSKLDELLLMLGEFGDRKIVIYSEWVSMLRIIANALPVLHLDYEMLYGDLPPKRRADAIQTFTDDPDVQVLLSSDLGRYGLNLQAADVVINFDLHWTPARLQQRVGRLERIGQKNTITCVNLVAEDTIEERVLRVLRKKTDLFRKVIDGDFSSPPYQNTIWQILDEEFGGSER